MRKQEISILVCAILVMGIFFGVWVFESNRMTQIFESKKEIQTVSEQNKDVEKGIPEDVFVQDLVYHNIRPIRPHMTRDQQTYTVDPETFEKQLQYLKNHGFTPVTFTQFADAYFRHQSLPEKPVLITFDDGWRSQYDTAVPLLKKYGMVATFFVYTQAIDHKKFMTWDELRELEAAGMDVESHTVSHPRLDQITDDTVLMKELVLSRAKIEKELKKQVLYFAYPFGMYTDRVVAAVRAAGYEAARTITHGKPGTSEELLKLHGAITTGDMKAFTALMGE